MRDPVPPDAFALRSEPGAPSAPLRGRVVRGSLWTGVGYGAGRVIRLGNNLILTRLLFPEAFGLMALTNVFLMGLAMFSDVGLVPSIVQSRRGDDPVFLDSAWTVQVLRGVGLWGLACALAWPLASFYHQAELAYLLPVAGLTTVFAGFNSTSLARLSRHLDVPKLTAIELAAQVVSVAVMIVWAWLHPTVWALVGGAVVAAAVKLGLSHTWVAERRNRFRWDRSALHELVGFGKWIFVSTILTFFADQSDRLIFGKTISIELLGIYSIAFMLASMPTELLARLGSTVVFPALSRKADTRRELAFVYRRARLPLLVLGGLAVTGLAAAGPPLVRVLYDPRYAQAGWIVQLLAVSTWFHVLAIPSGSALLAIGKPRRLASAGGAKVAGIAVFVPIGFLLGGFPGAIGGFVAAELLRYATLAVAAHREGLRALGSDAGLTLLLAGVTGAGLYAGRGVSASAVDGLLALGVSGGTAAGLWLAASAVLLQRERGGIRAALGLSR